MYFKLRKKFKFHDNTNNSMIVIIKTSNTTDIITYVCMKKDLKIDELLKWINYQDKLELIFICTLLKFNQD